MHNSGSISQNKNNQAQFYSHEAERILIQETLSLFWNRSSSYLQLQSIGILYTPHLALSSSKGQIKRHLVKKY